MSISKFATILTTILTLCASAYAQTRAPHLHSLHEHWFFSARTVHAGTQRVFYQVCNRSDGSSALRWHGAGFGVTAFAELESDFCAFKDAYNNAQYSPEAHNVEVQGRGTGSVITWSPDGTDGFTGWIYSLVETTFTGPDGEVEHSIISIEVVIGSDGSGEITISSSGKFDDVVARFPESAVDPISVLDLVGGDVDTHSTTLSDVNPSVSDETLDLTEGDDRSAPAMRITPQGDSNFTASFKANDLVQLGGAVKIYGRVNDDLVILNDVSMPEKPS